MKIETIVGSLWLDATQEGLTAVSFSPIPEQPEASKAILQQAESELQEYFLGKRTAFDVPLVFDSGTLFQREVWEALQAIPFGESRNYQEIAGQINRPKAVRAVGQANKANPFPIIVPCHRVLGKNGKLTGYMGAGESGLAIKERLLELEGRQSK